MMLFKLAWRNLLRHRRRSLLTGLSIIVGFVLSSFFIGWADGTYNLIIDTFTRNRTGHIQIHQKDYTDNPRLYKTIRVTDAMTELLENTGGVEAWAPRIYAGGLASSDTRSSGVSIVGIDPLREEKAIGLRKYLKRSTVRRMD